MAADQAERGQDDGERIFWQAADRDRSWIGVGCDAGVGGRDRGGGGGVWFLRLGVWGVVGECVWGVFGERVWGIFRECVWIVFVAGVGIVGVECLWEFVQQWERVWCKLGEWVRGFLGERIWRELGECVWDVFGECVWRWFVRVRCDGIADEFGNGRGGRQFGYGRLGYGYDGYGYDGDRFESVGESACRRRRRAVCWGGIAGAGGLDTGVE